MLRGQFSAQALNPRKGKNAYALFPLAESSGTAVYRARALASSQGSAEPLAEAIACVVLTHCRREAFAVQMLPTVPRLGGGTAQT